MCFVGRSFESRNEHYDTLSFPGKEWTLEYEKKIPSGGTEGGKFWIQIRGKLLDSFLWYFCAKR